MQEGNSPSDQRIRDPINRIPVLNASHRVDARASCHGSGSVLKERFSSVRRSICILTPAAQFSCDRPHDVLDSITLTVPRQIPAICKECSRSFT